jgi:hypoxanthine phosphoribosyltransferase
MTLPQSSPKLSGDLVRVLIDAEAIDKRVEELANQINNDYKDIESPLVLVGVLKGSFIFLSDLVRKLTIPHIVEFIAISSYGKGGDVQGAVRMLMDTREDLTGHDVLIVEDILDSGNTLSYLIKNIKARNVKSVKTAVFLDKPERHAVKVDIAYIGFPIPDVWVVGYGLDYKEKYRTLPFIAEMKPQL